MNNKKKQLGSRAKKGRKDIEKVGKSGSILEPWLVDKIEKEAEISVVSQTA